jgi:hypothetical protein
MAGDYALDEADGPSRRQETAIWALLGIAWLFIYGIRFLADSGFAADEASTGDLASGLVDGLAASHWHYQYQTGHGAQVFGVLLAPFYYWGGSQFLWIKIVGALFIAGGVSVWVRLVRRAWGFSAATIFFLLLLAPPPFLEVHAHHFFGNHVESIFFTGLLIWQFLKMNEREPTRGEFALLGLSAGFASFFCAQNFATAAAVFMVVVWRWGRRGAVGLMWAAPLFLSMMALNLADPRLTGFFTTQSTMHPHLAARWGRLLGQWLPLLPGYDGIWRGVSVATMATALIGMALGLAKPTPVYRSDGAPQPDWLIRILYLYLAFFFAAYSLTNHVFRDPDEVYSLDGARYLMLAFMAFLAFAAYALRRLPGAWKYVVAAPIVAAGSVYAASGVSMTQEFFVDNWRAMTAMRGDDYDYLIRANLPLDARPKPESPFSLKVVAALPRRWREFGCQNLGERLAPDEALNLVRDQPASLGLCRETIPAGMGAKIAGMAVHGHPEALDNFLARHGNYPARLADLSCKDAAEFVEGLGYGIVRGNEEKSPFFRSQAFVALAEDGRDWRETPADLGRQRAELAPIAGALRQLTPADFAAAFSHGAGRRLGFNKLLGGVMPADYVRFWGGFADFQPTPEAVTSFNEGVLAGQAQLLISYYNRFVLQPPFVDLPGIRAALARRGVSLRAVAGRENEFALEFGKGG